MRRQPQRAEQRIGEALVVVGKNAHRPHRLAGHARLEVDAGRTHPAAPVIEVELRRRRHAVPVDRHHEDDVGRLERRFEQRAAVAFRIGVDARSLVPMVVERRQRQIGKAQPALIGLRRQRLRRASREAFGIAVAPCARQQEQEPPASRRVRRGRHHAFRFVDRCAMVASRDRAVERDCALVA
ncbi:hypothetical protein OD750_023245 [Tahibacter sp. BL]|uniref:Uncharacterized protein n=1 Tax=Tahibacter soli TaxID=2983605 RepID=A0A9X3YPG9_9GAMM|nr:hypothetical protein [Tahibacter soli]MDC8015452.1 hypothetical protein [Tahibacter soli]